MTLEDPNLAETDTRASILGLRKLALAKPPRNRHNRTAMDRRAGSPRAGGRQRDDMASNPTSRRSR